MNEKRREDKYKRQYISKKIFPMEVREQEESKGREKMKRRRVRRK